MDFASLPIRTFAHIRVYAWETGSFVSIVVGKCYLAKTFDLLTRGEIVTAWSLKG